MYAIQVSLTEIAKEHIQNKVNDIPLYKEWLIEVINECAYEKGIVSKRIDTDDYRNCITLTINEYITKSEFDFGDLRHSVLDFADINMYQIATRLEKDNYDLICILCLMGYVRSHISSNVLHWIIDELKKDPSKFESENIPYIIYLWQREDIDDITFIEKILRYWVDCISSSTIDYDDYVESSNLSEDDIRNEITNIINDLLPEEYRS